MLIQHNQRHWGRTSQQWAYAYSMYLHLANNSVQVNAGQTVTAGQLIAQVDDTGSGLPIGPAPHLHLQIVVHPQSDKTLSPNTLDSENRSRNPELWLAPYNGNTARAIGKITDANGNPLSNVIICGMPKPYGGYTWSRSYSYSWANPDDIFAENFGTTDISPGTYHLYAYTYTNPNSTCSGTPIKDLGWHTFSAGQTTFIGLYPVYLPGIRSTTSNYTDSAIVIRNNSTTDTAHVVTTIFDNTGIVIQQYSDYLAPQGILTRDPSGTFTGSAIVASSQDVSVVVLHDKQTPAEGWAANTGIRIPKTSSSAPIAVDKSASGMKAGQQHWRK